MRKLTVFSVAAAVMIAGFVETRAMARDDRPVACVYVKASRIKRNQLVALVRSGFTPAGSEEKEAMMSLGDAVAACRVQNGWSEKRQGIAVRYMSARVLREDASFHGKKFGLTDEMLVGLVATLDAAGRAAYVAGQPTPELNRAAVAYLKGAGMGVDALPLEDMTRLGELVGQGVTGIIVQQEAEANYAAR